MRKSTVLSLIAAGLVLLALLIACGAASPAPSAPPAATVPAGQSTQPPAATVPAAPDGAALLEARCSVCHSVDRPKQAKKTLDQWDQTVTRMIGHGAHLTAAEKQILVDYLAKTYGP
jgi:cytochrome c5